MRLDHIFFLVILFISIGLISCGSSVTVYKAKHPRDGSIYDAWVKYNKETINPDCQHDYVRGIVMGTHADPLDSVEVKIEGEYAFTNTDGKFYLIIPDNFNTNKRVSFECPGYRKIQIPTKEVTCRELVVRMHESVRQK
jgi:hypothetical protein